jgi:hypothetical protein
MKSAVICTACFPVAPAVAADYRAGVADQGEGVRQLLVCEDGIGDLAPFDAGRAEIIHASPGITGAGLRQALFRAIGERAEADAVIFADCDDRLLPGAVAAYLAALEDADIAVANMEVTDVSGRPLGRNFFDGTDLPGRVADPDALARRNWMGLTNTAVRRAALDWSALSIPNPAEAADWWLFTTLLRDGLCAATLPAPLTRYRSNPNGTLGYGPAREVAVLEQRLRLIANHQTALLGGPEPEIFALQARAVQQPESLEPELAALPETGVWYEDVFRLAGRSGRAA